MVQRSVAVGFSVLSESILWPQKRRKWPDRPGDQIVTGAWWQAADSMTAAWKENVHAFRAKPHRLGQNQQSLVSEAQHGPLSKEQ